MTNIYITRHGQTEWNIDRRLQGASNSELTELGLKQAYWLQKKISKMDIDTIYSSPLKRAHLTAEIIRGDKNIDIITEDGLKEISFGLWEGMKMSDIESHDEYSKELDNLYNNPKEYKPYGGETPEQVLLRVHKTLNKILEENKEKNILIVSHGMTLKFIMGYFSPKSLVDTMNSEVYSQASFTHVQIENGQAFIKEYNDISHYEDEVVKVGW